MSRNRIENTTATGGGGGRIAVDQNISGGVTVTVWQPIPGSRPPLYDCAAHGITPPEARDLAFRLVQVADECHADALISARSIASPSESFAPSACLHVDADVVRGGRFCPDCRAFDREYVATTREG